ncbi:MAG: family 1 glycosylhydrolase [Clostridia bacterium]
MASFSFSGNFQLGVATAATQIEGGKMDSSWISWADDGHIKDNTSPERADDHYHLWREDTELLARMDIPIYRFGVEWARIEPEEGTFSEQAISHYLAELALLRAHGITPLVTLHHFTNPLWFEALGGFETQDNIPLFLRFVEHIVRSFGGLVNEYITINEPNVYAVNGFFFGDWPPGKRSFNRTVQVMSVLVSTHLQAYKLIHRIRSELGLAETKVGFANHLCIFVPANPKNPIHCITTSLMERFFQGSLSLAMTTGRCTWPLKCITHVVGTQFVDFHGVNYYARHAVSGFSDGFLLNVPKNDLGWEIYPSGIVEVAEKMYRIRPLPIYITENGTCDNQDLFRCRYLFDHLQAIAASPLPIKRYYHWCFLDNFEWLEGESARFGLVKVDYPTQTRTLKDSGRFYQEIIQNNGVTEEMYAHYVDRQAYPCIQRKDFAK